MKILSAIAAGAALFIATGAQADGHEEAAASDGPSVYTVQGTLEGVTVVGGTGTQDDMSYGASWTEKLMITGANGSTEVSANCVGMDQPSNSLFDRHFTCTASDGDGQEAAMTFGCNTTADTGNEMSCVGYLQGKEGNVADHVSLMTAYYWFMPGGTGRVEGSGHWIR